MSSDADEPVDSTDTDAGTVDADLPLGPTRDGLPDALTEREQWVCWHVGCRKCNTRFAFGVEECPECSTDEKPVKTTKIPDNAETGRYADSTDPETWTGFPEALAHHEHGSERTEGVGYVFTGDDLFVGIDLDNCRDPETGDIDAWAADAIEECDSYTAVSSSGTGVHIIARSEKPDGGNRSGDFEMYDRARFFALTGEHIDGTPEEPQPAQDAIDALHAKHIAGDGSDADGHGHEQADLNSVGEAAGGDGHTNANANASVDTGRTASAEGGFPGTDDELIETAKNAENGAKFERLWTTAGDAGYDSPSEADLALLNHLAFYTGDDAGRVERLARKSARERPKWDDSRPGGTWLDEQIETAIGDRSTFYDPDHGRDGERVAVDVTVDGDAHTDGDEVWADVRSLYADSDTPKGEARQAAFRVLDSREHFAAMRDSEELYQYDPETGIYRPNGDQYVGETLVYRLGRHHTTHEKREILDKLTSANWADRGDFGGSEGTPKVCVANGVLNIETGELTAHSPDERFVRRVNAAWPDDPDAATCPQFDALVRDVVGDDDARVIYNFLGLAVHPGYLKRSILLLHGEGGNGKTTLFDAIEQFLGPENVSNHTAHKLAGGKYATADLYGKMANVSDETPGRTVRHTETLKALSGDGTVEARRPYEGHFSFTNEAVLMFAANDPPEFDDDTVSIHQRLVPITCTNTFDGSRTKHEIVTDATTAAERSGVLVRAVEAARRLRNGGSVHRRTAAEARARYEKQSNTVAAFADAALEPDAVGWETNDDLYDAYVAYCEREDLPTKPRTSFFMTFEDAVSNVHDAGVEKTRRRVDGDRARGRAGVVFTSDGWRLLDSTRSTQSHLD